MSRREIRRSVAPSKAPARVILIGLVALLLFLVVRHAWLSDDAYITFRTVDHLLHGRGPVYNAGERVQASTHPLWMLLLSGVSALTREYYYTAAALSLAVSAAAVGVLVSGPLGRGMPAALGIALLGMSKAFVDFSTSGLENPLTHLLLAAFCARVLRPSRGGGAEPSPALLPLAALAGLATLNRMDSLLLLAPALAAAFAGARTAAAGKATRVLALGFAPFLLWEAFAVVYYGFPLPNTAYAKVWTGVAPLDLARQGLHYLGNSLRLDPVTPAAIAVAIGCAVRSRDRRLLGLAAGVSLSVVYVVSVGGDFMSGRFLSAPLLLSVVVIARSVPARAAGWALPGVLALGCISPASPLRSPAVPRAGEQGIDPHGISDERSFYAPWASVWAGPQDATLRTYKRSQWGLAWRERAKAARAAGQTARFLATTDAIGYAGFFAGPGVHIVDRPALADAFLARLPAATDPPWRIGHFFREIPDGYLESVKTGRNMMRDPALARLHEQVHWITRGPLFHPRRWQAIWELNRTG